MKTHMIIIDPQNSFCHPMGELYVPGADKDSEVLAKFIEKHEKSIDAIHVTLDSHNEVDIAHPIFWVNSENKHPDPFTIISKDDVLNGVWRTTNPACQKIGENYLVKLEENARYPLCIWPPHCIIGKSETKTDKDGNAFEYCGHAIVQPISNSLTNWAKNRFKRPNFVTKGSNPFTEHYSAVRADVPDPSDPSTQLNTAFFEVLEHADRIYITGQALSHCVAETIRDTIDYLGVEHAKKFILLVDTTSSVPGFEKLGQDFLDYLKSVGVEIVKTTDI